MLYRPNSLRLLRKSRNVRWMEIGSCQPTGEFPFNISSNTRGTHLRPPCDGFLENSQQPPTLYRLQWCSPPAQRQATQPVDQAQAQFQPINTFMSQQPHPQSHQQAFVSYVDAQQQSQGLDWMPQAYGVHSLPKLHSSTYYPIMRYLYCILLHAWPILLLNIPLCNIHIAFCYMNVTFGYMPFVNLILYYALLILYFAGPTKHSRSLGRTFSPEFLQFFEWNVTLYCHLNFL